MSDYMKIFDDFGNEPWGYFFVRSCRWCFLNVKAGDDGECGEDAAEDKSDDKTSVRNIGEKCC